MLSYQFFKSDVCCAIFTMRVKFSVVAAISLVNGSLVWADKCLRMVVMSCVS